jgi:hypothetical protein
VTVQITQTVLIVHPVNISIMKNVSTHVHTDIMKMIQLIQVHVVLVTLIVVIVLENNITTVLNVVEPDLTIKENVEKNVQKDGILSITSVINVTLLVDLVLDQ